MPRQARIEFAGAMYHVVAREDRREVIAKDRLFAKGSRKIAASNRVAEQPKKDQNDVKKPCLTPFVPFAYPSICQQWLGYNCAIFSTDRPDHLH